MPENIDNLILEHLRAMRSDITALRDDTREVKSRLTSLETAVSAMRREIADLYVHRRGWATFSLRPIARTH
jgi:predicted  nucleic acid-binding Zn-ribbon protein